MDTYDKRCFDNYGCNTCIIIHKENESYEVRKIKTNTNDIVIFDIQKKFLYILIPKIRSENFTIVLIENIKNNGKDITAVYFPNKSQ